MKLGIISDIHGDAAALERALSHLKSMRVGQIVCAGDLVGYGPFPDRVVAILREENILSVRGNHDRWATTRAPGMPDEFGGGTPGVETLAYLRTLPRYLSIQEEARSGEVHHGSPSSDMEFITRHKHPPEVLSGLLDARKCDYLIVGHTHKPMWYRESWGGLVVNPGSIVSVPVVDSSRTFAVVNTITLDVSFHDVETGDEVTVDPWA
jgi:putative phosphoesterase